ncbi:DDE_Tnp_1_7 domain-containing protein [Trichonephila inaurata madagascariensis]|uniref:DDE_Tnp_1_7 domain-containing protein n=1 Tax=Trichonephila inaurata madagascariensis TaxID=2747483 RepID=A0A8X7C1T0_9ARAC|nr:DDE_Tnp_1_7 domain-containing protein [Trichonephila inaurata madagascariensis]
MLEMAYVNSYVAYKELRENIFSLEYRCCVTKGLFTKLKAQPKRERRPKSNNNEQIFCVKKKRKGNLSVSDSIRLENSGCHWPTFVSNRRRGPERKCSKGPIRQGDKRRLPSSANSSRKRFRQAEVSIQERDIGQYNLRPRIKKAAESRPSRGEMQDQWGPVRSRGKRFQEPRPYSKKNPNYKQQTRCQSRLEKEQELRSRQSSRQCPRRGRGSRRQERQEMRGKSTSRKTASLEVLVGDVSDKKKY